MSWNCKSIVNRNVLNLNYFLPSSPVHLTSVARRMPIGGTISLSPGKSADSGQSEIGLYSAH